MKTLRQVMQLIEPNSQVKNVKEITPLLELKPPISLKHVLEEGSKYRRITLTPLTFVWQNMGLLVSPASYKGTERDTAIQALITKLRSEQPDVIGLCECFADGEREKITQQLKNIYPNSIEGPDESDIESDGGLLLLSKHPIIESHQTIYRQCMGEDCLANKGVLHARIEVSGHPAQYDIFVTHMQSCPPELPTPNGGLGSNCEEKLQVYQALHLCSFIQAYMSPQRPALLMGDLNQDALDNKVYEQLKEILEYPEDLWKTCGDGSMGITYDRNGSFEKDKPFRDVNDPERHKNGARWDYHFSWRNYSIFKPVYAITKVLVWQSSPGRDISDHYGLKTQQICVRELEIDTRQRINSITLILKDFRCLRETGGSVPLVSEISGSDEVEFELAYIAASGATNSRRTALIEDIDTGIYHAFHNPVTLSLGDPGEWLDVQVHGWEVDVGLGVETGRVSLGPEMIRLDLRELLMNKGQTVQRVIPLLRGDGGEYAVAVQITVQ